MGPEDIWAWTGFSEEGEGALVARTARKAPSITTESIVRVEVRETGHETLLRWCVKNMSAKEGRGTLDLCVNVIQSPIDLGV